jgi:GT2 family glycosyltransferase
MIFHYAAAQIAGRLRRRRLRTVSLRARKTVPGISVVIPSRNGRQLLAAQLSGIEPADEIIVVDNGSSDGTAKWLRAEWPQVRVEASEEPLSFAGAVNLGIARARCQYVCLLNNDMLLEPGFLLALLGAFDMIPDLFCATAQIRFPPGVRREETGKAVMAQDKPDDFPLRCDEPLPGEDLTYVLYGSGGCSLYDSEKLRKLGCMNEIYDPAYVEDLDIGYRAWQRGWPTVYVAGAVVEHRHRATTSRYYSEEELEEMLEVNYLRFVASAVADQYLFLRLWTQALRRLRLRANRPAARNALRKAPGIAIRGGPLAEPVYAEEEFLALTDGSVAIFPGEGSTDGSNYLVECVEHLEPPSRELLARYADVALVRGEKSSLAYQAAVDLMDRKWRDARNAPHEASL